MKKSTIIILCYTLVLYTCSLNILYSQVQGNDVTLYFPSNSAAAVKALCPGLFWFTGSDTIPLIRNTNGSWSQTFTDVHAGFYYYRILLDGAPVYDRASFAYLGWGTWVNAFEVKDTGTYSEQRSGPYGNINENYFKSQIRNEYRKCFVYTPAEYDANPDSIYPVIYLLNDSGEDESAWIYQGKINNIMDNAINNGEIEPMLVVLVNSNSGDSVISSELVPYIDSVYHTNDSAKYRAVAGCSEGGGMALQMVLDHRDIYANVGIFSLPAAFDTSSAQVDSIQISDLDLLWLGAGTSDASYTKVSEFHQQLIDQGIDHNWDIYEGSYNWIVWRKNFYTMIKNLFEF